MTYHYTDDGSAAGSILPRRPDVPSQGPRKIGRRRGQSSILTQERILDAAEKHFAENGYDGTSIRDVAAASGCQLQAVRYHFGPKEQLFDTVIQRRAAVMTDLRRHSLAAMRIESRGEPIEVARLVRAYVEPFIASAHDGDQGWRNYAVLMGRLANSRLGTEVIGRHYDETARDYAKELARSLPEATPGTIAAGFMFMVASMLSICADTGRVERLAKVAPFEKRIEAVLDRLVSFLCAGFATLARAGGQT